MVVGLLDWSAMYAELSTCCVDFSRVPFTFTAVLYGGGMLLCKVSAICVILTSFCVSLARRRFSGAGIHSGVGCVNFSRRCKNKDDWLNQ